MLNSYYEDHLLEPELRKRLIEDFWVEVKNMEITYEMNIENKSPYKSRMTL